MCFPCSFHLQNIGDCVCFCFNKCFYLKYWTKKIIIVILKILSQSMSLQCNSNYFMCNKKATSNNPVMDDKITSGLKSSKIHVLEHCMPSSAPVFFFFFPTSRKQASPASGHIHVPLVSRVSVYGSFDWTRFEFHFSWEIHVFWINNRTLFLNSVFKQYKVMKNYANQGGVRGLYKNKTKKNLNTGLCYSSAW